VCPARGVGAALVLPTVNIHCMNLHLQEISRQVAPGAHAVVILDGAGWHQQGGRLRLPDNISLLALPPYSPDLNPQENVWQFLRQNYLANRVFASYSAIVDACCNAWNCLTADPRRITSIATRPWAKQVSA
jgi:transposase